MRGRKLTDYSVNLSIINVSNIIRGAAYNTILKNMDVESSLPADVYDPVASCIDISVWENISSRVFWDTNKIRRHDN